MTPQRDSPLNEYRARLDAHQARLAQLDSRDRALSAARLVVVLIGIVTAWAIFDPDRLALAWLSVPIVAFAGLAIIHDRQARQREAERRAVAFYRAGIARIEGEWVGTGPAGEDFADPEHPCAADLDLFGRGSLFQLLCRARTRIGRTTLAGWLLDPSPPAEARARQGAVRELGPDLDLRERLAVLGGDSGPRMHIDELAQWASAPSQAPAGLRRWLPTLAVALTLLALGGWIGGVVPRPVMLMALLAQGIVAASLRHSVRQILATVDRAGGELELVGGVLALIEQREFTDPALQRTVAGLRSEGALPSARIGQLRRLTVLMDSRRNQMFAPFGILLMWTTQVALAIESWRNRHGDAVERWLRSVGELEALASLASHHYEHPGDAFPELVESGPLYEAVQIGHPLLPVDQCVRNDLRLDADTRLLIVSGSNMSGKSTMMRTLGINAVLAQAGAPVRAELMRVSPLRVGGSIRLQDSLRKGMSGFYAEIRRLRKLVEMAAGDPPLLFLLEELLSTTNSHDRRIGARAVLRSLVDRGAVGLVTTHDLALTRLAEEIDAVRNVHFEDHIEDGEVRFDYRLRDGVVDRSNAVELMRSIGLDV